MGFVASRLNLRLIIDGVEVPVVGARCTYVEGSPATAEIQVIGTDAVYDIPPRALVTLFYYENYDYIRGVNNAPKLKRLGPNDPRRWKLLFMGELIAINFTKESGRRGAILVCSDFTNYWDSIKQHYVNFRNGGVELFENAFLGVSADRVKNFDVVTKGAHSNIYTWLSQSTFKDADGKRVSSLYLGVQRIIREMFFAVNDFYGGAFNRLRMGDLIVGLPDDTTAAKLFKMDFFKKFIKNQVGGSGGVVSLRALLDLLLGTVFHTYVTVPCPYWDREGKAIGLKLDGTKPLDKKLANLVMDRGTLKGSSLNYTVIKPNTYFLTPPACNILFPHQYNSIAYQRNYLQEPTRLFLRTDLIFGGRDKWITERFYAPDFEALNALLYRRGNYLERLASVLLPHEKFVGLNPMMAWQEDLGAFVQKGARREYLSKMADYLYWKQRFGPRSLNVSMPFNPNLIPGYPSLVLDKVGAPGARSRHFLGNVQSVVHSIDQNGATTHMTMVAARLHDETADFDGQGRSLEEITSRGTDGFLDDRYDSSRIGKEVYKVLFGCGSLLDVVNTDDRSPLSGGFTEITGTPSKAFLGSFREETSDMVRAVNTLQGIYQQAVQNSIDINAFTQSITQRPKANLVDVIGLRLYGKKGDGSVTTAEISLSTSGQGVTSSIPESLSLESLEKDIYSEAQGSAQFTITDPEFTIDMEGFMSVAVDPYAQDSINDTFTRTSLSTTFTRVETVTARSDKGVLRTTSTLQANTAEKNTEGSWGLSEKLIQRQDIMLEYINSLRDRGLRG